MSERAGPLRSVAEAFARRHAIPLDGDATKTLAALAQTVDRFAARGHERDDDAFVEGAGACLGVALLAALPGHHARREGAHRVLLGEHGAFDPFAAIDDALSSDDPRVTLARAVAGAEAEAHGKGPIARVVGAFARAIGVGSGKRCVVDRFDLDVTLDDGTRVDLGTIARATAGEPLAAVERAAERLVQMLGGTIADLPWAEARDRLFPRLVGRAMLDGLGNPSEPLFARPIGHDVVLTLQLRFADRSRYVRESELGAWRLDPAEAQRHALERLAAASARPTLDLDHEGEATLLVARSRDGLDAARLLLPGLFDVLRDRLGEPPFLAAIPHRDTLLAARTPHREALSRRATDEAARAPHRISDALFEVSERGIRASVDET